MEIINENVIIASGKEMHEAGYMPANNDTTEYLWLKYKWHPGKDTQLTFAPFCDISHIAEDSHTHLVANKYYSRFPKNENGYFMFARFLSKYVNVKELATQIL
jgi:hypothetical protein